MTAATMTKHAALTKLQTHARELASLTTRDLFSNDPARAKKFSITLGSLLFDYSRHKITSETRALLIDLANACDLEKKRHALLSGAPVNNTEHRAAFHTALRDFTSPSLIVDGEDILPKIRQVREAMFAFAQSIRAGDIRSATGEAFTTIINIGIGGSDLGPSMAVRALSPYSAAHLTCHFVSNVDGADLADTLQHCDPARTLFIISSKTFTTQETMTNAQTARRWLAKALGEHAVRHHFAAVSTRLDKVAEFGIDADRIFGFWDFVGGRYSLWSSIGLSLAISIGPENFTAFLKGAEVIDQHFARAPFEQNIPVMMGLLAVWHRLIMGSAAHAVIPYDQRLVRFPAYLQQLDMESLGKSVSRDGTVVEGQTGTIIFGEPGTNGQHAFFQLLHQGTDIVPVDFLIAANPTKADEHHHDLLFANCLAQGEALMMGRTLDEAKALLKAQGLSAEAVETLAPHKVFSGSRPSSTLLYRSLTPHTLGQLIALYEHRVFVQSVMFDINPFDQWGVELGKELANRLVPLVSDKSADLTALDSSTAGLIKVRRGMAG